MAVEPSVRRFSPAAIAWRAVIQSTGDAGLTFPDGCGSYRALSRRVEHVAEDITEPIEREHGEAYGEPWGTWPARPRFQVTVAAPPGISPHNGRGRRLGDARISCAQ